MAAVKKMKIDGEFGVHVRLINCINNVPSQSFNLDKLGRQCSMKIEADVAKDNKELHNVTFSIDSVEKFFCEQEEFLKVSACFNSSLGEHIFTLKRTAETNFTSEKRLVYDPKLYDLTPENGLDVGVTIFVPQHIDRDKSLVSDIKNLLLKKLHADLKLVVDDNVYDVHKNILATRSQVFFKMIESGMAEKKTSTISLEEWDHLVVQQLLMYLYTDSCEVELYPHELFKLAHYLEIEPLQSMCKYYMEDTVNIKNIVDTLALTSHNQYRLSDLKVIAENFVEKNITLLAQESDYITYLKESISIDNIAFVLKFSYEHKIRDLLDKAMEYLAFNHEEILKIDACEKLLCKENLLMLELLKKSLKIIGFLTKDKKNEMSDFFK